MCVFSTVYKVTRMCLKECALRGAVDVDSSVAVAHLSPGSRIAHLQSRLRLVDGSLHGTFRSEVASNGGNTEGVISNGGRGEGE